MNPSAPHSSLPIAAVLRLCIALILAAPAGTLAAGERVFAEPLGEINFLEAAARHAAAAVAPRQVAVPFQQTKERARVPAELLARTIAPSPVPAGPLPAFSPVPTASFAALGDNGTSIPPDTHGAAGPNHLMATLNTEVQIQSRTGAVVSKMTLSAFWNSLNNVDPFDPKILYDPYSNRWMFTCTATAKSSDSAVLIAVSNTSDPTGTWKRYKIKADAASASWADYPSFGFNRNWIVVSVNMYLNGGSGGFDTARLFIFDKNTLYTGTTAPVTIEDTGGATLVPATTYDNTVNTLYIVEATDGNSGGRGFLRLSTITGAIGNEVVTEGTAFPSTTNTWAGVGSTGFLDFAPQLGSSQKIMNNDDRMQNVIYRNGSLWCTHTVFLPASTGSRSAVQWWQLSTSGNIQQFGRIDDATGGKFYAFPSIAVNKTNDAMIGYSRFSAQQYAAANYSFRAASDPPNTMQSETILKPGEAPYYKTYGGGRNRWGDYSATMVDPTDDAAFWTLQEYAETSSGGSDRFGTWWGQVASATPQAVTFSVNDISTPENNFGTSDAVFTVSLSQATTQTVTVKYATADGTATAGADYDGVSGTLSFPPNTTQRTVVVQVRGDVLNEGVENFVLNLSNPTNATIADGKGVCTIPNDDGQLINSTVSNTTAIDIPNSGAATPYSSDIVIQGVLGRVSRLTVTLTGLTHPYTGDIDALLVGPTGRTLMLVSDAGTGNAATNLTLTFDDTASQQLGPNALATGSYRPGNLDDSSGDDVFPAPAPSSPYGGTLSVFSGTDPNGTWKLFIRDDTTGNSGQVAGGWTLNLTTDTSPPPPTVSIGDATVIEGDTGMKNAIFPITLAEAATQSISVTFDTFDDTAVEGDDYTKTHGIALILPGQLAVTVSVPVRGDVIHEPNESFTVQLTPSNNAIIADGEGVVTIQDNDSVPQISIDDVVTDEGDSGTTNVSFTATLSGPTSQAVTVHFQTVGGTALPDADFVADSGDVLFLPGSLSKKITIQVAGDRAFETAESFTVQLSQPANATIADGTGACTINNDDLLPFVSINDVLIAEGNAGTTDAVFTLRLSGPTAQTVSVNYSTAPDSATSPDDFAAQTGTVTFAPGETSRTLTIPVAGDTASEPAEIFAVNLAAPQNALIAKGAGIATIVNDDDSTPGTAFSNAAAIEIPVAASPSTLDISGLTAPITRLTVKLNNLTHAHPQDLDILLVGPGGQSVLLVSDAGGSDPANGVTLTFDDAAFAGLTAQSLTSGTYRPTNLDDAEGTDAFDAPAPAAPFGGALAVFNGTDGNGTWKLFVRDDYPGDGGALAGGWSLDIFTGNTAAPPALSVNDASVAEGQAGTTDMTFTIALSAANPGTVTVHYQTSNGTARAGSDFTATSGTLTFAPNVTTQTFNVPILGDTTDETDEGFSVTLSAATNAIIADGLGLGTIVNDDHAGTTTVFSNNDGIVIPTNGAGRPQGAGAPVKVDPATPYGSSIEVSGLDGAVGKIRVVLKRIDHTFPDDIDILLVGPDGQTVVLMSDTGGGDDIEDLTLTFDDTATASLSDGSPIVARTVLPTNFGTDDKFLNPAPAPPYGANLGVFNGTNPNGLWQLFVFDDQGRDGGSIDGWSLVITTTAETATNLPRLSVNDVLVNEGNSGTTPALFNLTLSAVSASEVTVHYSTVPITATADADYVPQTGTVTFPAGVTLRTLTVPVKGDTIKEADETFAVQLDSATNAALLDATGTATITDLTDTPVPNDNFSNAQIVTGNAFTVTGSVNGATVEPGEPFHAGGSNSQSIWYRWTAPASGRVLVSTEGSTFDTVLGVYTGAAVSSLRKVAANNDAPGTPLSALKFDAVAGRTYFIAIAASSAQGDTILNLVLAPPYVGSYQGLIVPQAGAAVGLLSVSVDRLGSFTGSVRYLGKDYVLKGAFSASGNFGTSIQRRGLSPLQVVLRLDLTEGGERVTGSVSTGGLPASVLAPRAHFARGGALPQAGNYTFIIPGAPDGANGVPRGHGHGTLRLTKRGAVRIAGRLGDNTAVSYSAALSKDLAWPLYLSLYNKAGSISGTVQFSALPGSDAAGALAWQKPSAGLDGSVDFLAARYTRPPTANTRALASFNAVNGVGSAALAGVNLTGSPLTHTIDFRTNNRIAITNPAADKLAVTINVSNGLLSGTFKRPGKTALEEIRGVLFQKAGTGRGLFKDGATTGSFEMAPTTP